jgi:DNA replication and repair protein RecF
VFDESMIEIWDEQLIKFGNIIFETRQNFINSLTPIFRDFYKYITGNKEEVSLKYESHLINSEFRMLLKESQTKDSIFQYTTAGIHKDDFLFDINEYPLKKYGSQGQQKSFIIAIKLAQFDYIKKMKGYKPILLFDDLFDKLDDSRVGKLIELVSSNMFGQIFITETHKDRILKIFKTIDIDKMIYEIKQGKAKTIGNG